MIYKVISGGYYVYYEFSEDGFIEYNAEDISEDSGEPIYIPSGNEPRFHKFSLKKWEDIIVDIGDAETYEGGYHEVIFKTHSRDFFNALLYDARSIKKFYDEVNAKKELERKSIPGLIDNNVLEIAGNLTVLLNGNELLDANVLKYGFLKYGACYHSLERNDYWNGVWKDTDGKYLSGKKKKQNEKFNEELKKKTGALSELMDNFAEIIMEEKGLSDYMAKAVAWEAVQQKTVEFYAQIWREEQESRLSDTFESLAAKMPGSGNREVSEKYAESVILCDEIDIEYVKGTLTYYLISKGNYRNTNLYDLYVEYLKIIDAVRAQVKSTHVKNRLKTKQKRQIAKYTIDDVDLMNGTEFEDFICLMFKKMGYSAQVTQYSGDQGVDVVAVKAGTKIGIQAKCYSSTVGNSAIQEVVAGKSFYGCEKAMVVTNNYFTPAAEKLARSNNVILWNRDMLKEKIAELF